MILGQAARRISRPKTGTSYNVVKTLFQGFQRFSVSGEPLWATDVKTMLIKDFKLIKLLKLGFNLIIHAFN